MITTVVFDADDTLIDLHPAVTGGLRAVLDEMRRLSPAAAALTLADLEADWPPVFAAMAAEPVARVRRAALARSLSRVGLEHHLDAIAELFFARRFALSRPFAEVPAVLAELRRSYQLGFATNGNSRADRCGLAGQFAFEVYAHQAGVPKKPAPEFFAAVLAAAGATADQVVHVGDSPTHDVAAARAAGLHAIWLNRPPPTTPGPPTPPPPPHPPTRSPSSPPRPTSSSPPLPPSAYAPPSATITTLTDLPAAIRALPHNS